MKKIHSSLNQRGFVLIEFVIALPLIIMLLYGLTQSTFTIFSTAKSQAADYVLEVEAQDALTRIVQDLRAASLVVCYSSNVYNQGESVSDCENIQIKYHTNATKYRKYDAAKKKYQNITENGRILDIIDTRIYIVSKVDRVHDAYIYAQRQNGYHSSPITGGNFFGDTAVTYLKYRKIDDKTLHITLEMKSLVTNRRIRLSTAVFMPACEKIERL